MARTMYGEGSFFHDDTKGLWTWTKRVTLPSGKTVTKRISARKRTDLKRKIDAFKEGLVENDVALEKITLQEWLERWLEVYVKPSVKPTSYGIYREKVMYVCSYIGRKRLNAITSIELQEIFNDIRKKGGHDGGSLSAATVNAIRKYLNTAFVAAIKSGYMKVNPIEGTKPQRGMRKEIVALSEEEVRRLLQVAREGNYIVYGVDNPRYIVQNAGTDYLKLAYYNLMNLSFATGMRIGEACGLSWNCVDFSNNTVEVKAQLVYVKGKREVLYDPKTMNSKRIIPVDDNVMRELKEYKLKQRAYAKQLGDVFYNKYNLLFTNTFGKPVCYSNFRNRYFVKMLGTAGINPDFTIHGMRHTHATLLLKSGVNAKVVSDRLGHSTVNITLNFYAHVLKSMESTAAKAWSEILNPEERDNS